MSSLIKIERSSGDLQLEGPSEGTDALLKATVSLRGKPQEEKEKVLSLLETWVSTNREVQREVLLKLKQAIREELDYALQEKPCTQQEFIQKAFHLLVLMEPEQSFSLLKEQGKFCMEQNMHAQCIEILKEMEPKLAPSLREKVRVLNQSSTPEKITALLKKSLRTKEHLPLSLQAERGLQSLEEILEQGKNATTPSKGTLQSIRTLLVEASHNTKLNKILYAKEKKTAAEEFLCTFSYKTLDAYDAKKALVKFTALTGETTCVRKYLMLYEATLKNLSEPKKFLQTLNDTFGVGLGIEKELKEAIACFPERAPGAFWLKKGEEILQSLEEKLSAMAPKSGSASDRELFFSSIQANLERIKECKNALKALAAMIPELEKEASSDAVRLSRHEMYALDSFSGLNDDISQLEQNPALQGVFTEGPLKDLKELVLAGSRCRTESTTLVQTLHPAAPGDVLFDQEDLATKKGTVIWSKLRQEKGFSLRMLFSLIKSIFTNPNGVFAIQGFFLGDKVHVSLVNETRGQTNVFEVLDSYYDQSMKMNEAMKSVGYTPQFFNRLSVEGQSAVRTLWPGDSDEKIEEKLVQLHANTLRTYLEDKKKDFEPLTNPGVLAIGTFIRDFVETGRWPWITRPLREFFVGLPWKGAKKFYLLAKSREGSVPSEKEFMFCSEFSAMVIRDVQERMEDTLRKEMLLKNAKPARPLFRPIIPPHMTLESIHPTKLERLLKENGYYKRREPSLCLRLLLEKP